MRTECLDWLPILNRRHLEGVVRTYVDHYNQERPHRARELKPAALDELQERSLEADIHHRDRIGGLIHEYYRAAPPATWRSCCEAVTFARSASDLSR